ncbi:MAG: YfiR family protein [Bacteroidetes bacterium]|nr:YfiR family protein [Bacteroidota bacterium]
MRGNFTGILAGMLLLCCSAKSTITNTNTVPNNESTIKALFIYNFTKQIEWPTENFSKPQFTICVLDDREMADRLIEIVKGRKYFEKPFEVKNIKKTNESIGSQLLFIPHSNGKKIEKELMELPQIGLLIITDEKSLPANYSSINLVEKNAQLRFEINHPLVKKQNLKVSNNLLKLATNN